MEASEKLARFADYDDTVDRRIMTRITLLALAVVACAAVGARAEAPSVARSVRLTARVEPLRGPAPMAPLHARARGGVGRLSRGAAKVCDQLRTANKGGPCARYMSA